MQRPDEQKRQEIVAVATRLFATRAFHEVRLEDVAAAAKIGKGTVYIYFKSKEDLFLTLIREGFAQLVQGLRRELADPSLSAWQRLERIVAGHVDFATRFPHLFQLMRAGIVPAGDAELQRRRRELATLVERTIRRGTRDGEMRDPRPELTAQFVLSFVRGAVLYGPAIDAKTLRNHLLHILAGGILHSGTAPPRASAKSTQPERLASPSGLRPKTGNRPSARAAAPGRARAGGRA